MKKLSLLICIISLLASCTYKSSNKAEKDYAKEYGTWIPDTVYSENIDYPYGSVWAGDRVLISSYGTGSIDPLNLEMTGYIAQLKDGIMSVYIGPGSLMTPKGLAIYQNHLFVADINSVKVFDMNDLSLAPQIIAFPEGNMFVSDLTFNNNILYASVLDAGLIYSAEIQDVDSIESITLDIIETIIDGPNGICAYKDTLYINSYPYRDSIGQQNGIYMMLNTTMPQEPLYKLEQLPGYYCGIVYEPNDRMVYYTDQIKGQLRSIDMNTGENLSVFPEGIMQSPQMLSIGAGKLYVPDVAESKVYEFTIPAKK